MSAVDGTRPKLRNGATWFSGSVGSPWEQCRGNKLAQDLNRQQRIKIQVLTEFICLQAPTRRHAMAAVLTTPYPLRT